jgi:tetratricopeptide (TPR) repeat protein
VFSVVQMREAQAQRQEALRAARRATAMSELQTVLAGDARDADGRPLSPAARIAMAEGVVVKRFGYDSALVAALLTDLSNRYFEAGDMMAQRAMLGRAQAIARRAGAHNELALANCFRSNGYWLEDKLDSAHADVLEAKAALSATPRPDPDVQAICLEAEGKWLQATGKPDSGIALLRHALTLGDDDPGNTQGIGLRNSLAELMRLSGRTRDAVPYFQEILVQLETLGYGNTESFPNVVNFLATSLVDLGEFAAYDSTIRGYIRAREAVNGVGRVPTLYAFLHARGHLRLGAIDSADIWLTRALRDTTQGAGQFESSLAQAITDLRLEQSRLAEAKAAAAQLPTNRRGQRTIAAMLRARLQRAQGDARGASTLLEQTLDTVWKDGGQRLTAFALPFVVAGDWRLAAGDAAGADSLAQLARTAAAIDSIALTHSALAGRAELLRAQALRARQENAKAREAAVRAVVALSNGYGAKHAWTVRAQALADSLR